MSDSQGVLAFAIGLVNSVLNLPYSCMTGLKNFFEVFIAVGSWHSYFASPELESSPSTHSFCNVSQSHLLKYTLTQKSQNINNAFNPLQSFKNCQFNSVLEVNFLVKTKQYTTNMSKPSNLRTKVVLTLVMST